MRWHIETRASFVARGLAATLCACTLSLNPHSGSDPVDTAPTSWWRRTTLSLKIWLPRASLAHEIIGEGFGSRECGGGSVGGDTVTLAVAHTHTHTAAVTSGRKPDNSSVVRVYTTPLTGNHRSLQLHSMRMRTSMRGARTETSCSSVDFIIRSKEADGVAVVLVFVRALCMLQTSCSFTCATGANGRWVLSLVQQVAAYFPLHCVDQAHQR